MVKVLASLPAAVLDLIPKSVVAYVREHAVADVDSAPRFIEVFAGCGIIPSVLISRRVWSHLRARFYSRPVVRTFASLMTVFASGGRGRGGTHLGLI